MKKSIFIILLLLFMLCGCNKHTSDDSAAQVAPTPAPITTPSVTPESAQQATHQPTPKPTATVTPEPTPAELPTYTLAPFTGTVSPQVAEELLAQFAEFDTHPEKQDSMQSFSPVSTLSKQFATWGECEEYLGFSIPDPYEEYEWLEPVDYGVLANINGKEKEL